MKELPLEQLKEYLKNVIELESQILVGQDAIKAIEKKKEYAIYRQKDVLQTNETIDKPQKRKLEDFHGNKIDGTVYIERPEVSVEDFSSILETSCNVTKGALGVWGLISVVVGIILAMKGLGPSDYGYPKILVWLISVPVAAFLTTVIVLMVKNSRNSKKLEKWRIENQEYERKYKKEKEKRLKAIKEEYKKEMELYHCHVKEAEDRHKKNKKDSHQMIISIENAASTEIKRINDAIYSTKVALNKVYAKGIIFPKYQNFIAVCSLYEYLSSGRCNSLEGHEGAYNIYESELRQDLILIKLDIVISQLEDIKKNQYTLYQKMCEIKSAVSSISYQMGELLKKTDTIIDNTDKIANNTAKIAENTRVTALCSQMIAKNTEALKYISLIN